MNSLRWLSLLISLPLLSAPAQAWDQKGHRVVAAVAWDHMDADTRTQAVAILRGAAGDSDLLAEDVGAGLTQAQRDRALFLRAATWPDIVRATNHPARRAKYHHSPWHYLNIFWQERGRKPYEPAGSRSHGRAHGPSGGAGGGAGRCDEDGGRAGGGAGVV